MTMSQRFALALPAVVSHVEATDLAANLETLLLTQVTQGQQVRLDASALEQFDSSVLAVLLSCRRAAASKGGSLVVTGLPEQAQILSEVYGISGLLVNP